MQTSKALTVERKKPAQANASGGFVFLRQVCLRDLEVS